MMEITSWIENIIDELHDFEYHELASPTIPRDEAVAAWVLRCLGNVNCVGSNDVLQAIIDHRGKKDIANIVRNIEQITEPPEDE